jgi:hypothetical protein
MEDKFKLENLPKGNIYQVPEGYFEKLPSVIMQRIEPAEPKENRPWFSLWPYSFRVALATLVTGGFLAAGIYLNQPSASEPASSASLAETSNEELGEIPNEEIMQYLLASGQVDPMDVAELSSAGPDFWQEISEEGTNEN